MASWGRLGGENRLLKNMTPNTSQKWCQTLPKSLQKDLILETLGVPKNNRTRKALIRAKLSLARGIHRLAWVSGYQKTFKTLLASAPRTHRPKHRKKNQKSTPKGSEWEPKVVPKSTQRPGEDPRGTQKIEFFATSISSRILDPKSDDIRVGQRTEASVRRQRRGLLAHDKDFDIG